MINFANIITWSHRVKPEFISKLHYYLISLSMCKKASAR